MKKNHNLKKPLQSIFAAILCVLTICCSCNFTYAEKPQITATAAILIDANTGNVLFEKNADKKMYPASTTKIMTALVALDAVKNEEISLSQPLSLNQEAYDKLDIDGSSIAL